MALGDEQRPASGFGLRLFKTSDEAYKQDVAPRAAADDPYAAFRSASSVTPLAADDPYAAFRESAPAASTVSPNSGDFARGFGIAGKQLKQTAYGAAALIGDTVGSDSLKTWGLKGYKEAEKDIQSVSKESDSFTSAVGMGGGAVVDWLQYAAGYLTGQAAELGAASLAGAAIGGAASGPAAPAGAAAGAVTGAINKTAVQAGIRGAISKMVEKEAAQLTARNIERGMVKEAAEKAAAEAAVTSVYRTIGATAANTFLNATQELGSIYGEAVEEAAKTGQEYSLGKVWLSGILATAVDTWADSKAVKGLTDAFKGTSRASSIAVEAFKGGLREGLTEGTQTVIERWGADKDLATKEAFKEYIDSAAIGVLGGTAAGGASGAVAKIQRPGEQAQPAEPNITRLRTPEERASMPKDIDGSTLQMREDIEATLNRPDLMAALYMRGDEAQRQTIIRSIERSGLIDKFNAALQNPKALEAQTQTVEEYPDLLPNVVAGLDMFANTLPDRTFKVDQRTTGGTLEDERKAEEEAARQGTTTTPPVVEEPNDPSVVPKDELPARTGPQDDTRNAVITQFNEVGTQIFGMNPGSVQDAKFDWAMNQLVKTHGFSTADARSILTGQLTPVFGKKAATPPKTESQKATEDLKDALANLGDVLTDALGTKLNVAGQRYTVADLPPALAKVMSALLKAGYAQFKDASAELMKRMRANKDWAPLADKVNQGMLLKAWREAGGNDTAQRSESAPAGVQLTGSSPYLAKDQRKADKANKFIGRGSARSSTAQYARDFGALANSGSYDASDTVFISAEGNRSGRVDPDFAEIGEATKAGATVLTDNSADRNRPYNVGERQVAEFLSKQGYAESSPGIWKPAPSAAPAAKGSAKPETRTPVARGDRGPAESLRSQTRATKTASGKDILITNQNPINSRSLYMNEEEVKENERNAEEMRAGDTEERGGIAKQTGDDLDGLTMRVLSEGSGDGKKRNPAASYYRQALREARQLLSGRTGLVAVMGSKKPIPVRMNDFMLEKMGFNIFKVKLLDDSSGTAARRLQEIQQELNRNVELVQNRQPPTSLSMLSEQMSLGLPGMRGVRQDPKIQRLLDDINFEVRKAINASYYEDTIRRLQARIAEVDAQLKQADRAEGENGETFVARRGATDENPGLWGYQDENAYDRFSGGMVFDKSSPKNALLDMRRKLADDLQKAREGSLRGQARLYRIGMDRLSDYVIRRAEGAIRGGVDPEVVRAAVRPYLDGINALREANARPQEEEASVDPALEEANRNLAQADFFEGERVAAGILADFKAKRITQRELEELEQRGMRDGDFTLGDLLNAYQAMGVSPEQRLYAGLKHFSARIRLKDYVAQQGGRVSAVDAWFLDMQQARKLLGEERFAQIYPLKERGLLEFWQQDRSDVLGRQRVTKAMRESDSPRIAFKGFLFNRITLEEARNPDTIRNTTLRQTLTGLFDNLEEAWFQDVAVALRRRPSLANGIFDYRVGNNIASVVMEGVLSPQEQQAFRQWVERMKAGAQKEAEVLARVPYFEAIRNDGSLEAVRTLEGTPMVASTPRYDEVVTLTAPAEEVSPQSLMDEATQAIESFASAQRIKTTDIQKVEGADRSLSGRGFSRYTFVLKDGRRLVGEQLQLFPGGPLSSEGGYGIAVPEVMNAALKNDLQTVYRLFEKSDPRTQARTRSQTFYLSAEPDLFLERSAGRPDTTPSQYERLYAQIVGGEFEAVQLLMDATNRLKAVRAGMVDPETWEIITDQQADELAADALDSILMNAQMESSSDQYGASIKGDQRVVRTVEEAAARDAQVGGQTNVAMDDLSSEEQIQEGAISEFEGETQELSDSESEAESEGGAEQGPAADQREEGGRKGRRIPMSLEGGPEYRFRRGPAWDVVTGSLVQDAVNRLTADWKNAPNVVVLPNAQHLPEPLRARVIEKLAGQGAKGMYHDGTVYLFSQHLTGDIDVEFTLLHEAYGHLGMRAVLGAKFDQFLETAYRTRPEVKQAADDMIADGTPKLEAIDEVLSDMAAENRNVSVIKEWVGKMISGLREIGLGRVADWLGSMTNAEVASVLKAAREAARNGSMPAFNGAPAEIRFKTTRMPYEIFATKGGKTTGYSRYNPSTDTWVVFTATGEDIKDGHTATMTQSYEDVVRAMRSAGKVDYRTRSGVFVDDKIVADLVALPKFNDPKKSFWQRLRRDAQIQYQNEYLPVFEAVDYLASIGRLTDEIDVKTALTLYERRTGYMVEQFRKRYVQPIMKLVEQAGKLGVTKRDIDRYLTARHTEERNRAVAKINPGMQDGGSGLTYKDAREIIRQVEASPAARVMSEIGRLTDMMGEEKIKYLLNTGMITKAAAEKLLQYEHYINLSGERDADPDFDDPGQLAGGSKFNVKGKEKRAFGRGAGNEAQDVLSRTIQAYEAALIRGQKNLVAQKVLALFEVNYDPSAVVINAQPRVRQLNPETGLVEEVIDENYIARKDVMVAKINGIPSTIEFKDNTRGSFAEAIHGLVSPPASGPIMEGVGKVTRMLGALLTTYNPAFTLVNFFRDAQTMYLNAAADGRITKQMARDMIKALPKAVYAALHEASGGRFGGGADPEMLRVLREMQKSGGITYFADRKSLEEQAQKIDDLLSGKKYPGQEAFSKVLGALEFLADVSEIAPRLAAYKVVSDNGFTRDQAATFSGEITINFNMRGANKEVRQLFLFFNPAVQGSYKMWKLWQDPKGRAQFYKVAAALTAFGFLTSLLGRAVSGEDDDGIDKLDKVPVYKRATSVVLAADVPGGAPLPIPYGWNAFFATGVFLADTVMGKQPLSVTAKRIAATTAEAFSPVGMGASDAKSFESFLFKFAAPTVALPGVEFLANENRFGAPIRKEQSPFDDAMAPDAQQYFRGVSPISRGITDTLTELTGGNKYKAGKIDVNPATIDFLIQSYLPGLPNDLYKGASIGIRAAQGEEIKRAPWPLADRFSARIPTGYDAGAYRRAAEMVETVYAEYSKTRDQARRAEIRQEYPRIGYAHASIASTKQQLREVRQQIADLEERRMSDDARVERRNQLLEREEKIFKKAVSRLMQAGEPVREAMMANE